MTTVGFSPDDAKRIARTVKAAERDKGKYDHIRGRHNPTENLIWAEITAVGDATSGNAGRYEWTALEPDSSGGFATNEDWGKGTFSDSYAVAVSENVNVGEGTRVLLRPSMNQDFYVFGDAESVRFAQAKTDLGYTDFATAYLLEWDGTSYQQGDEITVYNTYFSGVVFGEEGDSTHLGDKFSVYYDTKDEVWQAVGGGQHFIVGVATEDISKGSGCTDCVTVSTDPDDDRDLKVDVFFSFTDIRENDTIGLWYDDPGDLDEEGHWDAAKLGTEFGCGFMLVDSTDSTDDGKYVLNTGELLGCGLKESDSTDDCAIEVDASALAGTGLTGSGCVLSVDLTGACGIAASGNTIAVDAGDLAGQGLTAGSGCSLDIDLQAGCGMLVNGNIIALEHTAIAGSGLTTEGLCSLAVNPGCHFNTNGDTLNLDVSTLVAPPLMVSDQTCDAITIDIGCGLEIDTTQLGVRRDMLQGLSMMNSSETPCAIDLDFVAGAGDGIIGDNTALTFSVDCDWIKNNCDLTADISLGCNLKEDLVAGGIMVDLDKLTNGSVGTGLSTVEDTGAGDCYIKVDTGCGITIDGSNNVVVDGTNLAGDGLTWDSGNCEFDIDCTWIENNCNVGNASLMAGCGFADDGSGTWSVDNTALAGDFLSPDGSCGLDVDLTALASSLGSAMAGCGITDSTGTFSLDSTAVAGTHLTPEGSCSLAVDTDSLATAMAGTGLTATSGVLSVDASCCGGNDMTAGCGLEVDEFGAWSVDPTDLAGDGLGETGDCDLTVVPGCGITVDPTGVHVNPDDLIGTGIKRAVGGCALEADMDAIANALGAGCGLNAMSGELSFDNTSVAGTHLTAGSNCVLNVDAAGIATAIGTGCGISSAGGTLSVDHTALAGSYLTAGSNCQLDVDTMTLFGAIGAGCGITNTAGTLSFDNTAAAGTHISAGTNCALDVNLTTLASALAGTGLTATAGVLSVDSSCCDSTGAPFWAMNADDGGLDINVDGSAVVFDYQDNKGRKRRLQLVGELLPA